jgi:hypothetical protein
MHARGSNGEGKSLKVTNYEEFDLKLTKLMNSASPTAEKMDGCEKNWTESGQEVIVLPVLREF